MADAIRAHSNTPLVGDKGQEYRAIGKRSLNFLGDCWRTRRDPLPDLGRMIESGKDVRFWSDAHFGHAAIIGMCDRPFANGDEMDAAIWAAARQDRIRRVSLTPLAPKSDSFENNCTEV